MKTKGEIEDLKSVKKRKGRKNKHQKKKNDCKNGKDISRTFSGGVVGSVGQFIFR